MENGKCERVCMLLLLYVLYFSWRFKGYVYYYIINVLYFMSVSTLYSLDDCSVMIYGTTGGPY